MKYCPECGKLLETEVDFKKDLFNNSITLMKRCKYCKKVIEMAKVYTR